MRYSIAVIMAAGCSHLCGCAAIAGGYVGDALYSGAFRTKIEETARLSTDEVRQLREVRLYRSAEGLTYASKGPVKGLSCKVSAGPLIPVWRWIPAPSELNGATPEEGATTQLKVKAVKAGGNAVLSWTCSHDEYWDLVNNCFETWICTGEAALVE